MSGKVYDIKQNTLDSQQSRPWAAISFLSFKDKSTYSAKSNNPLAVSNIVVVSDILSVNVSNNKGGLSNVADATLASGHLNYDILIAPGDHALIWINNDYSVFDDLTQKIRNNQSSNSFNSGLKFVGRVNSVRKILTTDFNGTKSVRYNVTFSGFTELNSMVYFNPLLAEESESKVEMFYAKLSKEWGNLLTTKGGSYPVSDLLDFFIDLFLGKGPDKQSTSPAGISRSPNNAFLVPQELSNMLGIKHKAKSRPSYADILHTIMGIQKYNNSNSALPECTSETKTNVQKITTTPLSGRYLALPDQFNNTTVWSLLDAHKNSAINEMYCTLREDGNGKIMPTLIVRQIPFSTEKLKKQNSTLQATYFSELPKWKIDDSIVTGSYNIGTSNSLRFNFVQIYGQLLSIENSAQMSQRQQIKEGNYAVDVDDILRNGSKNMIINTNADVQVQSAKAQAVTSIAEWKNLIADWYIDGHLKLNGSITLAGIKEPICVGDNLEYDNKLFHIESVNHNYAVDPNSGIVSFYTTLALSHGVKANGDKFYENRSFFREDDKSSNLPGYTDEELYIGNKYINSNVKPSSKDE